MAVVSRPLGARRKDGALGAARRALESGWTSVLACVLLLVLGYALLTPALGWGQRRLDDLRYGYPRTTQVDGFVGHGETGGAPTHLVAINLQGQVSVLEIPGGDAGQVRPLVGPYLVGADGRYVVPHLALRDLTGDGRDELLLQVRDEVVVYVNDGDSFRLATPAERAQIEASGVAGR